MDEGFLDPLPLGFERFYQDMDVGSSPLLGSRPFFVAVEPPTEVASLAHIEWVPFSRLGFGENIHARFFAPVRVVPGHLKLVIQPLARLSHSGLLSHS